LRVSPDLVRRAIACNSARAIPSLSLRFLTPLPALPDGGLDPGRRLLGVLMLPDAHHGPPGLGEAPIGIVVAQNVAGELRYPVPGIRLRRRPVFRAGVPEAAIDEDGHLRSGKGHVGASTHAKEGKREVDPVAEASCEEDPAQGDLRGGRGCALRAHAVAGIGGARAGATSRPCFGHAPSITRIATSLRSTSRMRWSSHLLAMPRKSSLERSSGTRSLSK